MKNVIYAFDSENDLITRDSQPFADGIQGLTFTYYNDDGAETATFNKIRQITISITVRTSKTDPGYPASGGYRTYTLTSSVTPRNLDLASTCTAVN